ncbi:pentapeptide repeat-containing protein [Mesorhizobium neociceri]|uniref:Pentapeptide repeat-containing protein n=1 Tax=Mesorhizobium neociceri TaxID=1307853 RepID=A0A838AZC9_9HYPH|nr:pentapeptide repeat-containing protein [Mesorhizobium neociceri]MBA1139445.1 pentapeptide repeat-containing protein [Mesorhizobium neociceri]
MSETAATTAGSPAPVSAAAPFESFAVLHREHSELRQRCGKTKADALRDGVAENVRQFIRRAAATGVTLGEPSERKGAQAIIEYWCSELLGLPNPQSGDFKRVRLAEPSDTLQAAGATKAANARPDPETRDVIRLAATARLWRDSGKKGFLLTGDALSHAAKFRSMDDDIEKLVHASQKALQKIWMISTIAAIGGVTAVLLFLFVLVPLLSERAIVAIKKTALRDSNGESVRDSLWQLGLYQPLQKPYDLSGNILYREVKAPGLKLNAPNFSSATFISVDLQGSDLHNASFSNTSITGSNFNGANLSLTQFREANIAGTSFADAGLYRAIFDRACIGEDVNFEGADLRLASFWGATFDDRFPFDSKFRNSPWWLAEGWNSRQIAALLTAEQAGFFESKGFEKHIWPAHVKERAAANSPGASENQLAWDLATWGLPPPATPPLPSPSLSLDQICSSRVTVRASELSRPELALDAAEEAVCIVQRLKKSDSAPNLTWNLANLQDTRAYVLLQSGRSTEAADIYRNEVTPILDKDGGALFRAAVAHQAIDDRDLALAFLKRSVELRYVPSHEMHTLRAYIKGDFQKAIYEQIDRFRPSMPPPAFCQGARS